MCVVGGVRLKIELKHEEYGEHSDAAEAVGMQHNGEKTTCRSNAQCGLSSNGDQKTRDKAFVCLHAQLGEGGIYRYNYRCNDVRVPEGSACFCQKLIGGEVLHWQFQPVNKGSDPHAAEKVMDDALSHASQFDALIPTMILGFLFV